MDEKRTSKRKKQKVGFPAIDQKSITERPIDSPAETTRVYPRKVTSGATRGTWTIVAEDQSKIEIGIISDTDGEFGIAFFDTEGNLVKKMLGPTTYIFNPDDDDHNVYQDGKLPEGYGVAVSKEGFDVSDGFED